MCEYEISEKIAIESGKKALNKAPWLYNRRNDKAKGFFVELRDNERVHPGYCSVHCVDGNGTKLYLSAWSDNYKLAPIDSIAMNANDMATILYAFPSEVDIYMACQTQIEEEKMEEIMNGFVYALEKIRIPDAPWDINMGKIETASLDEMISLGVKGKGVDFGIVMTGYVDKDKIPNLNPKPGNIIVGVSSTGLHSNGYTEARHALLTPDVEPREEWKTQYRGRFSLDSKPEILEGKTVLEALQTPTALYLVEAAMVGKEFDNRDIYGVNITGNGLHNFNRVGQDVSFEITDPMEELPIHKLLSQESKWNPKQAYTKQNMGMGFAYIVPDIETAEEVVDLISRRGEHKAKIVGEVEKSYEEYLKTILNYKGEKLEFVGYSN